jgi:hypothetical protein
MGRGVLLSTSPLPIVADNPGDLRARTTYSMERISSREQLGVSLRAEYSNLTTDVRASSDYNAMSRTTASWSGRLSAS